MFDILGVNFKYFPPFFNIGLELGFQTSAKLNKFFAR